MSRRWPMCSASIRGGGAHGRSRGCSMPAGRMPGRGKVPASRVRIRWICGIRSVAPSSSTATTPADRPRGQADPRSLAARPSIEARPADVGRDLVTLLRGHGVTRLYWSACGVFAVVSVAYGLTVWCDGRLLRWRTGSAESSWPASDLAGPLPVCLVAARACAGGCCFPPTWRS